MEEQPNFECANKELHLSYPTDHFAEILFPFISVNLLCSNSIKHERLVLGHRVRSVRTTVNLVILRDGTTAHYKGASNNVQGTSDQFFSLPEYASILP